MFYKQLELVKIAALKKSRGSSEAQMQFSELAKSDTTKSGQNIKLISQGDPDFIITTDASLEGWGACWGGMEPTGGRWLADEIAECGLKAAKLVLLSLCEKEEHVHIHLQSDNATTVTFMNNMGGRHSMACNKVDRLSRKFQDRTEWQLQPSVFKLLTKKWGTPEVGLFASRLN